MLCLAMHCPSHVNKTPVMKQRAACMHSKIESIDMQYCILLCLTTFHTNIMYGYNTL